MSLGDDQRRPVVGTGVEKVAQQQTTHRVSRPTDTRRAPRVTGVLLVDISQHPRWANASVVRTDIQVIEQAPAGAQVRLVVGKVAVSEFMFAGLAIGHVFVTVESGSPSNLQQWITALREVIG